MCPFNGFLRWQIFLAWLPILRNSKLHQPEALFSGVNLFLKSTIFVSTVIIPISFPLFYCLQGKTWHWGLQCECNFVGTFIKCWGELTGLTDFEQCLKDDLSEASFSWWCHSSSQVLSEMEDEVKFESDINSGFFWPWRSPNGSVIYTSLHKYTVKVVKNLDRCFFLTLGRVWLKTRVWVRMSIFFSLAQVHTNIHWTR